MFFSQTLNNHTKKTILTAPLDWGLGHATRCIPIIKELNDSGHRVIIAAEGPVKSLLMQEFPINLFIPLRGYQVKYSKKSFWLQIKLLLQLPRVVAIVFKEHFWLKRIVKQHQVDMIISDNRFGLFHKTVPCVYITHQLHIKTGNRVSEKIAQSIHRWVIKKYKECWIPDFEKGDTLSGALSHLAKELDNTKYIGCLSRFEKKEGVRKKYDLLVLISGPEPQRTIFENKLLEQARHYRGKILFIRGLPGLQNKAACSLNQVDGSNIVLKDHLSANELCDAMQESEMVICRSGYTTVMDLVKLEQKAILVPTPGQTEQEYLAEHLFQQHFYYFLSQDNFNMESAIKNAEQFDYKIPETNMNLYKKAVQNFLQTI